MNKIESLYLHFPFCRHLCNYCDFYKNIPEDYSRDINSFHQLLTESMTRHKELLLEHGFVFSPLKTLYIGGGTPSLWGENGARYLRDFFHLENLSFAADYEFTQEVNPGSWNQNSVLAWEDVGVNRFSFGMQTYNAEFLPILDRVHSLQEATDTFTFFSKKKANYSIDLMLGLPFSQEKKRDVIEELKSVLEFDPKHFSIYILTVKPQYKYFANLPSDEYIEEEYLKVSAFLQRQGFLHYEVSNFAKPGFESRHNLNYWDSQTVAALGPSATGLLVDKNSQNGAIRYKWKTSSADFEVEGLDKKALELEGTYLNLRTNRGLPISHFTLGKQASVIKLAKIWEEKGLARLVDDRVILTPKGYLLMDSMMGNLFTHIN